MRPTRQHKRILAALHEHGRYVWRLQDDRKLLGRLRELRDMELIQWHPHAAPLMSSEGRISFGWALLTDAGFELINRAGEEANVSSDAQT